jgi:hypothetical protein
LTAITIAYTLSWGAMPSTLRYEDYTVGWIYALQVEVLAARFMLDEKHGGIFPRRRGGDNDYIPGIIGGHNIIIVGLPKNQSALSLQLALSPR